MVHSQIPAVIQFVKQIQIGAASDTIYKSTLAAMAAFLREENCTLEAQLGGLHEICQVLIYHDYDDVLFDITEKTNFLNDYGKHFLSKLIVFACNQKKTACYDGLLTLAISHLIEINLDDYIGIVTQLLLQKDMARLYYFTQRYPIPVGCDFDRLSRYIQDEPAYNLLSQQGLAIPSHIIPEKIHDEVLCKILMNSHKFTTLIPLLTARKEEIIAGALRANRVRTVTYLLALERGCYQADIMRIAYENGYVRSEAMYQLLSSVTTCTHPINPSYLAEKLMQHVFVDKPDSLRYCLGVVKTLILKERQYGTTKRFLPLSDFTNQAPPHVVHGAYILLQNQLNIYENNVSVDKLDNLDFGLDEVDLGVLALTAARIKCPKVAMAVLKQVIAQIPYKAAKSLLEDMLIDANAQHDCYIVEQIILNFSDYLRDLCKPLQKSGIRIDSVLVHFVQQQIANGQDFAQPALTKLAQIINLTPAFGMQGPAASPILSQTLIKVLYGVSLSQHQFQAYSNHISEQITRAMQLGKFSLIATDAADMLTLTDLGRMRRRIAELSGTERSKQFGMMRNAEATWGVGYHTPLNDRYARYLTEFLHKQTPNIINDVVLCEGRVCIDTLITLNNKEGSVIPLTSIKAHASGPRWIHTDSRLIPLLLRYTQLLINAALQIKVNPWDDATVQEVISKLAEIHWFLAHIVPFWRGAATVTEWIIKALFRYHRLQVSWDKVMPDCKALIEPNVKQYQKEYITFSNILPLTPLVPTPSQANREQVNRIYQNTNQRLKDDMERVQAISSRPRLFFRQDGKRDQALLLNVPKTPEHPMIRFETMLKSLVYEYNKIQFFLKQPQTLRFKSETARSIQTVIEDAILAIHTGLQNHLYAITTDRGYLRLHCHTDHLLFKQCYPSINPESPTLHLIT